MTGPFLRRLLLLALSFAAAPGAAPLRAQTPVVVELFTSQGCASCPPADALLAELAERPDVIALSLHVDYWDYLGWRDQFARPEHTLRQKAYRDVAGARSLFTPQMVVQGRAQLVGSRRDKVLAAIEAESARPPAAQVTLRATDGALEIVVAPGVGGVERACVIWAAAYDTPPPVAIAAGENAGRVALYRNVVRSWMRVGAWDGAGPRVFRAPMPMGAQGVAVLVQEGEAGPILGAAKIDF
ncbi:DUF1223 domain-containing protein [Oceanicella actignis]|uniref:DUF1223 domain-containing protein n=1 Tax=Oceanicella actignis TaxID=1189325 RepID=UPI001253E106|nr:DUF1223 domain-containing protein [Oceanicella actignis]TYO90782.1 hypothetical protein LY05_00913 [Oceanicella actignis]